MSLIRARRDLRVDFFRGLALWWIFADHVPGNVLANFSLRNFTLCDATEVFVLLAGYGAGIAYGGTLDRQGWLYSGADVLRRAWNLYVAHIFLFVLFAAQVSYSAQALDRADFLDEIHLDVLGESPYRALLEALLLHFQPAYLNILPMYVALLLIFTLALPLLRRPPLLLGLSFALYATARGLEFNLPSWTGGGWFFNPLAWQLLFMMGAILSHAPGRLPSRTRLIDIAAVAVLAMGGLILWLWDHPDTAEHLPAYALHVVFSVDKTGLHPFRVLCVMALAWMVRRLVPPTAKWLRSRLAAPFVLAGQHSLPVFCAGIFLSFLGRLGTEQDDRWMMQIAVNVLGGCGMMMVATVSAWYRAKTRLEPSSEPVERRACRLRPP
jgi:hypothetical protein